MPELPKETWEKIRVDYERQSTPIRELARRYGISPGAITSQARRHGWTARKQGLQRLARQSVQDALAARAEKYGTDAAWFTDRAVRDGRTLAKQINSLAHKSLSPRDLDTLASAYTKIHGEVRKAIGMDQEASSAGQTLFQINIGDGGAVVDGGPSIDVTTSPNSPPNSPPNPPSDAPDDAPDDPPEDPA